MNFRNDKHKELQRREQELQAREQEIRLRELEAEINQPALYQTVKHRDSKGSLKQRFGQLVTIGKFLAIVVAVVVGIKIGTWLASLIIVGSVAWVVYKLFFEGDRSRH
jgi:Flp pilus assembly protein TadB